MKTRLIVIALLVIAFGVYFGVLVPHSILNAANEYYGKEVFTTEQSYDIFKQELVTSNATWSASSQANSYVQALSSDPPIIVHFDVFVARGTDFSYGKKIDSATKGMELSLGIFLLVIVSIYSMPALWKDDPLFLFRWSKGK